MIAGGGAWAVDVAGVTLRGTSAGSPDDPAVVLLHGGGSRSSTWALLSEALVAARLRVIAPDLRGHGGSTRTASYPLDGFRDDVRGLIDALGLDRVALVGHSLGGYVACAVAMSDPARVRCLVLEEPPAPPRSSDDDRPVSRARLALLGVGAVLRRASFDPGAVAGPVRQLRRPDPAWWTRLKGLAVPALVVSGGPTSHIPPARLALVAGTMPDAELVTVPAGHRVHSTAPTAFAAAVVPRLARR